MKKLTIVFIIIISFVGQIVCAKGFTKEEFFDYLDINTAIDKNHEVIAQNNFSRNDKNVVVRAIFTNPKKQFNCELKLLHFIPGSYQDYKIVATLNSGPPIVAPNTEPTPEPNPEIPPDSIDNYNSKYIPKRHGIKSINHPFRDSLISANSLINTNRSNYNMLAQSDLSKHVKNGIDEWVFDNTTFKSFWFTLPVEKLDDGQWKVELYINPNNSKDKQYIENRNFYIRYNNKIDSLTSRSISDDRKPLGITDKFYTTDREVYVFNKITYISDNLDVKWIYYLSNGDYWYEYDGRVNKDYLEFLNQTKYYNEIFINNRHSMLDHREKKLTGKFKVVTCIKNSISGIYEEIAINYFEIIKNSSIDIKFTQINESVKKFIPKKSLKTIFKKEKIDLNKKIKVAYELVAKIQKEDLNFYEEPNYIENIHVYWKDANGEDNKRFSKLKKTFFQQTFNFEIRKKDKSWFEIIAYDRFGYREIRKFPLSTISKENNSMYMSITWFLNGKSKKVIPEGFKGTILKLHSWWGNHGLKVDLNNNNIFEHINYDKGYNKCNDPDTCVDYAFRDFSFNNGFSLNDFYLWVNYWHDPTHGKIKCYRNDCIYNPYGAGATFKVNSRDFQCLNNEWYYQNVPILSDTNDSILCRQFNVCGDGIINENEECDDFNQDNGDGCNAECKKE